MSNQYFFNPLYQKIPVYQLSPYYPSWNRKQLHYSVGDQIGFLAPGEQFCSIPIEAGNSWDAGERIAFYGNRGYTTWGTIFDTRALGHNPYDGKAAWGYRTANVTYFGRISYFTYKVRNAADIWQRINSGYWKKITTLYPGDYIGLHAGVHSAGSYVKNATAAYGSSQYPWYMQIHTYRKNGVWYDLMSEDADYYINTGHLLSRTLRSNANISSFY